MNKHDLEQWLERHHYPQLVLAPHDVVKHSEWSELLASTGKRCDQALARIQAFLERVERERTAR